MINKLILTIIYLLISGCSSSDSNPPTSYTPGNHSMNSLWFVPNSDGTWGIGYSSNVEIGGLQLTISGANIISVISGDAQNYGFSITANGESGIILGFSFSGGTIPAGSGILFSLELDGIPVDITNIVISDGSANSVNFTFDATYFSSILENTGNHQLIVFEDSITTLQVGDEIGIFDLNGILNYNDCSNQIGEILVGTGKWQGTQFEIVNIGSVDYCDLGGVQLAGYVSANPIIIKVWDTSEQILKIASPEYLSGSGMFSEVITVISELSF